MEFLKAGDPPVYIGFGSIVVEDPDGVTNTILDAVQLAGVRAVVSAGWGGLGAKNRNIPSSVFLLPDKPGVPHDWLFKHVSIVCHHGGAGTTAIGLFLGKPTIIVPFFGDQPFWGQMVYRTGAGPKPIHPNELSPQKLADGIRYCQTDKAKDAAEGMGAKIRSENGPEKGVESFYRHLPLLNMRCDLYPDRLAVWWSRQHYLKLSSFAAQTLVDAGALNADTLERHRSKEYSIHRVATNPLIGGVLAPLWTVTESTSSLARVFTKPIDGVISTVFAVPRGLANFALSVQEGLQYAPTAFGVDVREPGEIRDWKSGMREGGRAFGHGLGDGISGFFTEPYHGMKEEGITGVFKGSGRGLINAQFKPMAGTAALFTHSTRGVWNSVKKRLNKGRDRSIGARDILLQQGREEFDDSTEAQRQLILQRFEKAKETYPARRKAVKQKLKLRRRPSVEPETSVARTAPAGVGTDAMETYVDCRPSEEWMEQNGVEDWTAEGNSSSESDSSSETFGSDDISNDPPSAAHHTMLTQQG
ncbi:hypothetical protein FRC03_008289 [Tulasnella sp. 419]|nr:hypothetical protein FRC03_008289 [Tulasnella sp. 419]